MRLDKLAAHGNPYDSMSCASMRNLSRYDFESSTAADEEATLACGEAQQARATLQNRSPMQ